MSEIILSEASKRRLRFAIVLPVLIIPFVTVTFWLMDGGKSKQKLQTKSSGLNMSLPEAKIAKDSARDKLSFYLQADADSIKKQEQIRRDPNFSQQQINVDKTEAFTQTESVENKIASIRHRITKQTAGEEPFNNVPSQENHSSNQVAPNNSIRQPDPEMEAINRTLDKLAALQHPPSNPGIENKKIVNKDALTVTAEDKDSETYFGRKDTGRTTGNFFDGKSFASNPVASLYAVVPTTQELQTGAVIRLQLVQAISVQNKTLAAGSLLYGIVALENERLMVTVPSIRINGEVWPVSLSVFDMDGLEGIYVPGSISREITKSSTDNVLQSVNVLSLDPSIKTQATMAGINAAKSLLSKKVKLVRATITAGYRVILKNNKTEDHE